MPQRTIPRLEDRAMTFAETGADGTTEAPFWDTVAKGKGSNGLYMPDHFPRLPPDFFAEELPNLTEAEIASYLQRQYIPDDAIADEELLAMMEQALTFGLPLEQLDLTTFLLRLDQGPTASFKDIAARILAALMEKYCEKHQKHITLVVATSGDTGVAIANAFGSSKWINVTILYPPGGVSEVQEKQMVDAGQMFPNVQSIPVEGSFDNAQDVAKILLAIRDIGKLEETAQPAAIAKIRKEVQEKLKGTISEEEIRQITAKLEPLGLSSANSINLWRLLPQMTQYFVGYRELLRRGEIQPGEKIVYAVPSGNVGHLTAGLMAEEMGLPVQRFIAGTNANNIFANIIGKGMIAHRGLQKTSSPSMDILDPSNVERIFTIAARRTGFKGTIDFDGMKTAIKSIEDEIKTVKKLLEKTPAGVDGHDELLLRLRNVGLREYKLSDFGVTPEMLAYLKERIWVEDVDTDEEVYAMMGQVHHRARRVLDPHGTTAYIATRRAQAKYQVPPETKVIIFDTAHPHKFPGALEQAGIERDSHPIHRDLEEVLARTDMSKKPDAEKVDVVRIAERISAFARRRIEQVFVSRSTSL